MTLVPTEKQLILDNLFPGSHESIVDWETFPWHRDRAGNVTASVPWSSQALAIDVLGTIRLLNSGDDILNGVMAHLQLPTQVTWKVELEWSIPGALLGEPRSTQVDAAASGASSVVLFECKFTEKSGGACSQPQPLKRPGMPSVRQCTGSYGMQTNPHTGKSHRCALAAKGVLYWEWIPTVLGYDAQQEFTPCPFAGGAFQWMRNAVAAAAVAAGSNSAAGFVLLHAGGPDIQFPIVREVQSQEWKAFQERADAGGVRVRVLSYRDLLSTASRVCRKPDQEILRRLTAWVHNKEMIAAARHLGANLTASN